MNRRKGFTLLEILIVVSIIGLLAAIALPNFMRARGRSQASRVLEDLRLIDGAITQYALENGRESGYVTQFGDIKPYLKTSSNLYVTGTDLFGRVYGPFVVDTPPKVATVTFNALSDVAPREFWSPYLD